MGLGTMRELVLVECERRIANGQGGWTTEWQQVASRRADVLGLSGDESLKVAVERSVTRWRVTLRAIGGLNPKHRLIWFPSGGGDPLTLNIISVVPDKSQRSMSIALCESGLQ